MFAALSPLQFNLIVISATKGLSQFEKGRPVLPEGVKNHLFWVGI